VAGILTNPKERSEVTATTFDCLDREKALILFAIAEAVLGEGFLVKAPRFIETVDDYLNYQRPAQRKQFLLALTLMETIIPLTVGGMPHHFSHLSLADRRKILEKLRSSSQETRRNIYAAFVNVSASTYYASELTWPELNYKGVSVDHPEILNEPPPIPWRPDDLRPIEP
jgi:hypothetical protein